MAPRARLFKASEKLARGEVDVSGIVPSDIDDPHEFLFRELISLEDLELPPERPLQAELRAFVDSVRSGGAPEVSGEEGLAAIRLAERVLKEIAGG